MNSGFLNIGDVGSVGNIVILAISCHLPRDGSPPFVIGYVTRAQCEQKLYCSYPKVEYTTSFKVYSLVSIELDCLHHGQLRTFSVLSLQNACPSNMIIRARISQRNNDSVIVTQVPVVYFKLM